MSKLKKLYRVFRNKSTKYLFFRSTYELARKTGMLSWKYPVSPKSVTILSLAEWRTKKNCYLFRDRDSLTVNKKRQHQLAEKMHHILQGDVLFFGKTWYHLGIDDDWVTNPETGYRYNPFHHWTKIEELDKDAGDIKYVWEKSRFSWLCTLVRYDYHFDEDHSEFVVDRILDWIEKNPQNCGPNYKCSQEISIRLNNWVFALMFYKNSMALTDERWERIMTAIYWQIDHIYKNINFSRIAVRNNHAITETLTLYLMGLLFPQFPHADKWKRKGKKWFEEEIDYQIADDGTYIQNSMNYHRVVVQLLTFAIAIADANGERFCDQVYEKAYKSINFLYQCQEPTNGWLSNYGPNDGALFFPLSEADFRDFRPQLDALHGLLTGQPLYDSFLEDAEWVQARVSCGRRFFPRLERKYGLMSFRRRGYYFIREKDTLTFIRCGNCGTHQLHVDVWHLGENLLKDAGSYKYNTKDSLFKYFAGTESHNTIMLDSYDQMQKGPRFMWFYPPRLVEENMYETETTYVFSGAVNSFRQFGNDIILRRKIVKEKGRPVWRVEDRVENKPLGMTVRQLWHTSNKDLHVESDNATVFDTKGLYSDYYGVIGEDRQVEVRSMEGCINTTIWV